jgi:hypothetical protein
MNQPVTPALRHKAACYDDEGRLECCCELAPSIEAEQQEKMSRAEAHRLVEQNSLNVMAAVRGAMT